MCIILVGGRGMAIILTNHTSRSLRHHKTQTSAHTYIHTLYVRIIKTHTHTHRHTRTHTHIHIPLSSVCAIVDDTATILAFCSFLFFRAKVGLLNYPRVVDPNILSSLLVLSYLTRSPLFTQSHTLFLYFIFAFIVTCSPFFSALCVCLCYAII